MFRFEFSLQDSKLIEISPQLTSLLKKVYSRLLFYKFGQETQTGICLFDLVSTTQRYKVFSNIQQDTSRKNISLLTAGAPQRLKREGKILNHVKLLQCVICNKRNIIYFGKLLHTKGKKHADSMEILLSYRSIKSLTISTTQVYLTFQFLQA